MAFASGTLPQIMSALDVRPETWVDTLMLARIDAVRAFHAASVGFARSGTIRHFAGLQTIGPVVSWK